MNKTKSASSQATDWNLYVIYIYLLLLFLNPAVTPVKLLDQKTIILCLNRSFIKSFPGSYLYQTVHMHLSPPKI